VDHDDELIVDVLGASVTVRAPAAVLAELRIALVDLTSPASSAPAASTRELTLEADLRGRYRLLDDHAEVLDDIDPVVAAASVVWRLNAIAASAPGRVMLHAGCVAGAGAVLIPGRSGAGKSTLVAACVEAGMSYLSDEYAVIDLASGEVVPYPKPLSLTGERLVAASALRAGSVGVAVSPGAIVFPRYEPGAPTAVTRLDPQWTLAALAAHATSLEALGAPALQRLAGLAAALPAWQATYDDGAAVAPRIIAAAAEPPPPAPPADIVGPITPTTTTMVFGDELAVFDHPTGQVHILNEAAAHVWTCVPDVSSRVRLVEVAVERAPAGSLDPTRAAATLDRLDDIGLLPRSLTERTG
jgi:hypothetical protein